MPEIGEIKKGREIGLKSATKRIWQSCPDCGKERWVQFVKGKATRTRCHTCSSRIMGLNQRGKRSKAWKGGYTKNSYGYIEVYVGPDDFFRTMAKKTGYVLEHRLVMAKHLGRCLLPWEIVHHKPSIAKGDNKIEGLQLVSVDKHNQMTIMERRIKRLELRVEEQQKQIKLLHWQLKEQTNGSDIRR